MVNILTTCDDDKNFKPYSHEQQANHKHILDESKYEFLRIYANQPTYDKTPKDFDKLKTIGTGSFGTVFLVRDVNTLEYHAMKAVSKREVVEKKNLKQLYMEKRIMQCVNFPVVMSLDYCCKDNLYVYFILPFESGGDLFTVMRKLGLLSEPLSQFYAAQLVLAVEYLHNCSVIHRDLKPENVLLNKSGYIKVADFGFSKILKSRTWTLCGTPEYLAPEIILSKGYTYPVDWWAVGVFIFEMISGYPPFYHSEPMKLYEKVLTGQFRTPDIMSATCKSLVKHLLTVDPLKRFGSLKAGVYDIKSHDWFNQINFDTIYSQKMCPPYLPLCKNAGELTGFDEMDEIKLQTSNHCLFPKEFENF